MLTPVRISALLEPFGLELTSAQLDHLATYLGLLLRWNQRINLTAIRTPEECVTRHFGESLYLARRYELQGSLLDIGSGAGFPGLALKLIFPELAVTLLEPSAKKRAFLKEVVRACGFGGVEVRGERLEEFANCFSGPSFDAATVRAVGRLERLIPLAATCLKPGGRLCLWLSREQRRQLVGPGGPLGWEPPIPVPLAREREILVGIRSGIAGSR